MSFCLFAKGAVSDFWKWIGQSNTTHFTQTAAGGVYTHDGTGEQVIKREIWGKTVEREMAERHYKREKVYHCKKKKGYEQTRAFGPALILPLFLPHTWLLS